LFFFIHKCTGSTFKVEGYAKCGKTGMERCHSSGSEQMNEVKEKIDKSEK
jgi:hypothetical protein